MSFPSGEVAPMLRAVLGAVSAVLLLCSCVDPCASVACGPCPPALQLNVRDAASGGGIPAAVSVSGADIACAESFPTMVCSSHHSVGAGTYALEVMAPGYTTQRLTVTVPRDQPTGCCRCGYVGQVVEVRLTASGR
ncbi:MAG TPA: hypothetical protein VK447_14615 [Myxococcaceae bacterium]|nr:hypothetical protein [Myxococcaceae bacterium]